MISKLSHWLSSTLNLKVDEENEKLTVHLAAAVLLLEVGKADFELSDDEKQVIEAVLSQRFDLTKDEADAVLAYALAEHEQYTSSHPFVRMLNEELEQEAKLSLLEGLWEVAYADGVLDKYEEYHVRKIADWLYLSHSDFIRLKNKVADI
jgi:uncharacterized tellurite resistance protein B-like protein